ncbi:N-acyl amino acid synthase FeeM domain-containing protein [Paraburkholderia megapolitana]|uniref:N-acyl amino acid synthase FeeM domain-containing protein n=1 Tax=Paraburkholderia megapolitana TaxID=420953 RepID=UPI0038BA80F3
MDRLNSAVIETQFLREHADSPDFPAQPTLLKQERLPFTIRIVADDNGLEKAVQMRRIAYRRHLPDFADKMTIENSDREPGTVVLLAESKLDGGPLGTMRIQSNEMAPLALEQSVVLPEWLATCRLAEATRFGVEGGAIGRMVKIALCKALFMYCEQELIDWVVITARAPLDREYKAMLFDDVFGKDEFLPMAHVGGVPHRVMAQEIGTGRKRWEDARIPLYRFIVQTYHPDIDLNSAHLSFGAETVGCPRDSQIA